MISLPGGGAFEEKDLIAYIQQSGRNYIIQGLQNTSFKLHSKPNSLDYWLRKNYAGNPDNKQADKKVLDALVKTGRFEVISRQICPDSGKRCNAIRVI